MKSIPENSQKALSW